MKKQEAAECAKKLGKLFPGQLTDELSAWGAGEFLPFSPPAVAAAIEEHRRSHEFISWPQLLEGCRAAERGETTRATVASAGEGSWFDVRRRQNPNYRDRHDVEVALRTFRAWWIMSSKSDAYRRKFISQCTVCLIAAAPLEPGGPPLDPETADLWARTIFDEPQAFRQCLEQIRDTVPTPFMPAGAR